MRPPVAGAREAGKAAPAAASSAGRADKGVARARSPFAFTSSFELRRLELRARISSRRMSSEHRRRFLGGDRLHRTSIVEETFSTASKRSAARAPISRSTIDVCVEGARIDPMWRFYSSFVSRSSRRHRGEAKARAHRSMLWSGGVHAIRSRIYHSRRRSRRHSARLFPRAGGARLSHSRARRPRRRVFRDLSASSAAHIDQQAPYRLGRSGIQSAP